MRNAETSQLLNSSV